MFVSTLWLCLWSHNWGRTRLLPRHNLSRHLFATRTPSLNLNNAGLGGVDVLAAHHKNFQHAE